MICKTQRLSLKNIEEKDAEVLFLYRSDKELCEYQNFMIKDLETSKKFIQEQTLVSIGQKGEWKQIGIYLNNDTLIGDCAIQFDPEQERIAEIGCTLRREFHNKGYATEALLGLIDHVFENYPIHKFKAVVDIRNLPSQRMVSKLGFRKEGHFVRHYWDESKQDWFDELYFGLLNPKVRSEH